MDDRIAELLCDKCRPLLAAALKLERAELQRKQARDELKALTQGKIATADDDAPDMVAAMQLSKGKMSGRTAAPAAVVDDDDKGLTRHGVPRLRAAPKLDRHETKRRINNAHDDILRVIRGDFPLATLTRHLSIAPASLYFRVEQMIGAHRHGVDPHWQAGYGYKRHGKRAYDVLKKKAGKAWKEPSQRTAPSGPAFPERSGATVSAEPRRKPGRPRSDAAPRPTITTPDLQALSNGEVHRFAISKKYKIGYTTVNRQLEAFRARFGADVPEDGTSAQADAPVAEEDPAARITDTDLMRLRLKRIAVSVIADRYALTDDEVRAQLSEWMTARVVDTVVAAEELKRTSNGDSAPPTLESIAQQVLRN